MDFFITIYTLFVYQPLFNVLVLVHQYIPGGDLGITVVALTVAIRFLLYPMTASGVRMQKKMADLQPKIKELQKKYKDDKTELSKATFALYKEEGVNPFATLGPLLLQLPLFIALFQLFGRNFNLSNPELLYSFVADPGVVSPLFLGVLNLNESYFPLALLAGALQFVNGKQMAAKRPANKEKKDGKPDFASMMQTQMIYFLPLITIFLVARFPSAFGIYWTVTILFMIGQHWYISKKEDEKKVMEHENNKGHHHNKNGELKPA